MTNTKHKDFAGKGNVDARNNRQNKELQNEGVIRQTMEDRFYEIPYNEMEKVTDFIWDKKARNLIVKFIENEMRGLLTELVGKHEIADVIMDDGIIEDEDVVTVHEILSSFRERGVEL